MDIRIEPYETTHETIHRVWTDSHIIGLIAESVTESGRYSIVMRERFGGASRVWRRETRRNTPLINQHAGTFRDVAEASRYISHVWESGSALPLYTLPS